MCLYGEGEGGGGGGDEGNVHQLRKHYWRVKVQNYHSPCRAAASAAMYHCNRTNKTPLHTQTVFIHIVILFS